MRFPNLTLLFLLIPFSIFAQHNVSVNTSTVLSNVSQHPVGMNVNHLMDDSFLSPAPARSTTQALSDMGVKFLRYPGGEKADNYYWSVSPWDKPRPEVTRTGTCEWPSNDTRFVNTDRKTFKPSVLDFDEFITMCRAVGAEPLIVVGYDGMYKAASCGVIPTKAQLIKTAEEWVKYANITKKHNIKYWMIGNESFMSCTYNGCATATQYRNDVIDFSVAMKAIDPSIKIIANGEKATWWQTVLPTASQHIDYLGLSNYPVWQYTGGYDYYRTRTPDLMKVVTTAVNSINQYAPTADRNRLKIIVTEFGSMDWQGSWKDINDLGHAMVSFEMMGEQLKNPKVEGSYFWNTRWVNNATQNNDIYDALNRNGGFHANGLAHSLWGRFLTGGNMVQASGNTQIRVFANHNPATNKMNVFIMNKETSSQNVNLSLSGFASNASGKRWEYKGNGPLDVNPTLQQVGNVTMNNTSISLTLPSVSITILELSAPSSGSPTVLATPTANDQSRCGSGTLNLSASNGINYRWYKNLSGGSILHTGANFTTPQLTQTDSFYVSNFDGTNESARVRVRAIIHAIPSQPTASDVSRCGSGTVSLTASGGTSYRWFSASTGGTALHTGSIFTTPSLSSTRSYWVENFNSNCSSQRIEVKAIINAIPPQPTASDVSRCGTGSVTLSASGGTNYRWFSSSTGGSALHTGSSFTTPSLSATTSYWVDNFNSTCTSPRREVKAVIESVPAQPTANDASRCGPGTVTLTASGGTSYRWFSASSGGNALHTGSSFTTPTLSATSSYWVESFNTACSSTRREVKAIINTIPPQPTASDVSRCGAGSATLTASGGTNYRWFSASSGGNALHTGSSFTTPSLSSTTSYWVENFNSTCSSQRIEVKAIIEPIPAQPTANDASRCGPGTVTLTASGGTSYRWFNTSSGGNALHTGATFNTPTLSSTTSYWVESFNASCTSTRREVKAIINAIPPQPMASDASRCGTGSVTLTASGGTNYRWFSASSGGSALHTGSSFTTPSLSSTTSYWVENFNSTCSSQRVEVKAVIEAQPVQPTANDASRCGAGPVTLTASGGTSYRWFTTSSGSSAVHTGSTYSIPSLSSTTSYWVEGFTENCTSPRKEVKAIILPLPGAPIATGAEQCGPGSLTLSAIGQATLNWYASQLSTAILGTGPSFTTPQIGMSHTYFVVSNDGTCNSLRVPAEAVIKEVPDKPEILQTSPTKLYASEAGIRYTWKLNGQTLPDNTREIEITSTGSYTVKVEGLNGCFSLYSDEYSPLLTSIENQVENGAIKVYPNPNHGRFIIEIPVLPEESEIKVVTLAGQIVYSEKATGVKIKKEIDLNNQAAGVYFLLINMGDKLHSEKLIVK
jgi:alpha-L-arabinofuranosidase